MKTNTLHLATGTFVNIEHERGNLVQMVEGPPPQALRAEALRLQGVTERLNRRANLLLEAANLLENATCP